MDDDSVASTLPSDHPYRLAIGSLLIIDIASQYKSHLKQISLHLSSRSALGRSESSY